jgi:putative membrane protein insertion efficiency factor
MDSNQAPTEWEQETAYIYVHMRHIVRPKTSTKKAFVYLLLFVILSVLFTWLTYSTLTSVGVFEHLPFRIQNIYHHSPYSLIITIYVLVMITGLLICSKRAVIGLIKLYQHYASDEIRQRCIFMPTCSEYALMVIKKYGLIVGGLKSYKRLIHRCKGNVYMIDYP